MCDCLYVWVCVRACGCVYVCVHVVVCICLYAFIYGCMFAARMCVVRLYVWSCVCLYVCWYADVYVRMRIFVGGCMCVCVCVVCVVLYWVARFCVVCPSPIATHIPPAPCGLVCIELPCINYAGVLCIM